MPSLGVLALGDSITNGGGELQWGVALQSWALWTARALGLPYSPFATDGATARDVVGVQLPALGWRSARPEAHYELACVYIGANDVRALDWAADAFERDLDATHGALAARAQRRLAVTIPLDLGRPRAGPEIEEANAAIERVAARHGVLVLDLRGMRGRRVLMADHVHPTAFGQLAIAERALDVLAADGMEVLERPWELVRYETTRVGRLRGDATYAYRSAKQSIRAAGDHLGARLRQPRRRPFGTPGLSERARRPRRG
ncbi:MAG: GDSL-type esterase/lipase family protein [Solirubrobacteraceae bacterium MAG38_C4-C5]|nr:GDSL-type esterase/lipase family protein [Candidatus Siliceabacter maunaloa]